MVSLRYYVVTVVIMLCAVQSASPMVLYGEGKGRAGEAVFLGKFCFGTSGKGELSWKIKFEPRVPGTHIVGLVDTSESYYAWKGHRLSCHDLTSFTSDSTSGFTFPLDEATNLEKTVHPSTHGHPHFWRVYAVNCDNEFSGLHYRLSFLDNGSQFSHDQKGIIYLYICSSVAFAALLSVWTFGCCKLRQMMQYIHPIVRLLTTTITLQLFSVSLFALQYTIYAFNGKGYILLVTGGRVLEMGSIIVFTFLLMCLAQGWTVTTSVLTHRWLLAIMFSVYFFLYILLLVWNIFSTEWASEDVEYFYSSFPGICLLVVRMATLTWFAVSIVLTIRGDMPSDKRRFLMVYGVVGATWFFSLPMIVCLAWMMDPWNRGAMVETIFQLVSLVWYSMFVYLMWPSRAEYYFRISASEYLYGALSNEEL